MPARVRKPLIDYEPKRRNPITLGDDSNIDKDLKVIRVDSKNSILELSENELKVRGTLDASDVKKNGFSLPTKLDELSDVTYSSGDLTIDGLDKIVTSTSSGFKLDSSHDIYLDVGGGEAIFIQEGGSDVGYFSLATADTLILACSTGTDLMLRTSGSANIELDSSDNITIDADDDITISGDNISLSDGDVKIDAAKSLYFDGGSDTRIVEVSDDIVRYYVGGDIIMSMQENGDDGNQVSFVQSIVGFQQLEPTYDSSITNVDFRHSNKQFVTFGSGNITNLSMYFPEMSGNFVVLLKQDGTGSRTITNYRVYEYDETLADGDTAVKFAGGSNPTLTTDANHVDIISIYWDADNEIAYGVATLDFQD